MNANKSNILSVATKMFWEKGYHNTSIEDIAKGSNNTKSNIFYYFKGKENLLQKTIYEQIRKFDTFSKEITLSSASLKERYDAYLDFNYNVLSDNEQGCFFGKLVMEINGLNLSSKKALKDFFDIWFHYFKSFFEQKLSQKEATEKANYVIIIIQGATTISIAQSDFSILKKEIEKLKKLL